MPVQDLGRRLEGPYLAFPIIMTKSSWLASKRAREERALAAERRMETLKGRSFFPSWVLSGSYIKSILAAFASSSASASSSRLKNEPTSDPEIESDAEALETDQDRRRTMLESVGGQELDEMKAARYDFSEDFRLPGDIAGDLCSDDTNATLLTDEKAGSSTRPGKHRRLGDEEVSVAKKSRTSEAPSSDKTEHQPDDWNCLVCTLYVVKVKFIAKLF
jgi:hypothetical protein